MILIGVRKLGLLSKAANTGNVEMWKDVVAVVQAAEHHLLREVHAVVKGKTTVQCCPLEIAYQNVREVKPATQADC